VTESKPSTGRALRAVHRLLRVVVFLVLAVLLLGIGAYVLRGPLFGRLLADRIELELGKTLGGRFSVVRVEGSYLFELAVVGLRTEEAPPGALRRLDCGRAVVKYDLKRLLRGDLGAISYVLASNLVVDVDLRRSGGAPGAAEPELPAHLPRLEICGNVALTTGMGEIRGEGVSINTIGTNQLGLRAKALSLPGRFGPPAPFAGTVERKGPLAFVLSSETPVAGITAARVAYDGALDADLLVGPSAAHVRIAGGEAHLTSEALDLAQLPAWVYPEGTERPRETVASLDARVVSFAPFTVEVKASAGRIRWRDVDLRDGRIEARYAGGGILVGSAHAEGHGVTVDARDVAVDPELPWFVGDVGEAIVQVADLRALEPRFDRPLSLSVKARRAGTGGVAVEEARLEGEGILLEGKGEIVLPDEPSRWQEAGVSAAFTGNLRDFASGAYAFTGEMRLAGKVTGTVAAPEATAQVEGRGLTVEGRTVDRVTLDARVAPPLLEVRDLRVEGEAGTLRAHGAVDLDARAISDAGYEIDVSDLAGFLRLFPGAPVVEGTLSGRGSLVADAKGLAGTVEIGAAGLVSGGKEIGTVTLKARAQGGEITVEEAAATGPWGAAKAKGTVRVDQAWASVEALTVDAGPVHGKLNRPFRIGWARSETHAGPLDLEVLGGRVEGTIAMEGPERVLATLRGEGIDLSLLDARLGGRAVVDLAVDGERYDLDVIAPGATYEGRTADIRLKARSGLDGIVVEKMRLDAGERLTVDGTATLPWRFDGGAFERVETAKPRLTLEAHAQRLAIGETTVGDAVLSVQGDGRDLTSTVRMRDLSVGGFAVRGETLVNVISAPGRIEATGVLERCDLGDAEARITADKGFDWTEPDAIRVALDAMRLDGEIKVRAPDLAALRRLVPGLAELSGAADGTVVIRGPLLAPSIEGGIHLAGVEAKPRGSVPRFTRGSGDVSFDGTTLRIEGAGELGYSPVGASGTIVFGAGGPLLDLKVTGTNALLVADPGLRVRADLDLLLSGAPDALKVGGKVRIADALYTRANGPGGSGQGGTPPVEGGPLFSIRGGPLGTATFDLEITADETIRARTPSIAGDLSCDIRLRGTGEAPAPEGRIFFRDLVFEMPPVAPLKVDRGEIRFPPGEPFDPRIDVTAHTRLKGYDLEVALDGRLAEAQLHIGARPALSQDDAILLLGTGYTRKELEGEGIQRAAFSKLASFLGAQLVSRFSGPRDPDERTFLERFRFTVGKEVSRSGESTIEAEFEASDRVFLRVERDRFDEYNGGVVWRIRFR